MSGRGEPAQALLLPRTPVRVKILTCAVPPRALSTARHPAVRQNFMKLFNEPISISQKVYHLMT